MPHGTTNTRMVVAAAMSATFLAALDTSIVGTAMPTVIGELGGLSIFSWVFSGYLLTSTTTVPIYGRLSDIYGRKPLFLAAAAIFVIGSALCGISQNMIQLIVFRGIQGVGAGGIIPVTMTVLGDVFPAEQRAKLTGLFSAVWGGSALLGPTVGGFIVDYLSWRWVFYINLPVGIVAMYLFWRYLHEKPERSDERIDYLGAIFLTLAITALLFGFLRVGEGAGPSDPQVAGLFASGILLLAVFLWQENRFASPMLPLNLFRSRIFSVVFSSNVFIGAVMFGVTAYVPLYAQGVLGGTAVDAGLILLPFAISWSIGAPIAGKVIVRAGYRVSIVSGVVAAVLGAAALQILSPESGPAPGMVGAALVGLGMGLSTTAMMISTQNSVSWNHRGIVTAMVTFSRTIGGAVGVAALGALLTARTTARLSDLAEELRDTDALLDPDLRNTIGAEIVEILRSALDASLHEVFFAMLVFALLAAAIVITRYPSGSIEELRTGESRTEPAGATAEPASD